MPWLTTGILSDLLSNITHPSPVLNVLQPLVVLSTDTIRERASGWILEIQQDSGLDTQAQSRLIDLLVQFLVQRFSQLTRQEIDNMLELTPLEKTRAGQELLAIGMEQGEIAILSRLIGQRFRVAQQRVQEKLQPFGRDDFEALAVYLWQAQSYQDIERWLNSRAAAAQP